MGRFRPPRWPFFLSLEFSLSYHDRVRGYILNTYTIIMKIAGFGRLLLVDARQPKNHENHGLSQRRVYIPAPPPATMRSIPNQMRACDDDSVDDCDDCECCYCHGCEYTGRDEIGWPYCEVCGQHWEHDDEPVRD